MWSIISKALKLQDATNAESGAPNPEMCLQCEADLTAYEEYIESLMADLELAVKDAEERRNVIIDWKKKAVYMKKLVGDLEEDEERERRKAAERDARNVALNDELRQIREYVSQLDQESNDVRDERDALIQVAEKGEERVAMLERELALRDDARKGKTERKKDIEWENVQKELARLRSELSLKDEELTKKPESRDKELDIKGDDNVEATLQVEREKREVELELDRVKMELEGVKMELDGVKMERDNLSTENSQLRAKVLRIQRDNASMEISLAQRKKQIDYYKEDIIGLNIALDSKQQEVELVKRIYEVHKIAGPTPPRPTAAPSTTSQPPARSRRRLLSMQLGDAEKENVNVKH